MGAGKCLCLLIIPNRNVTVQIRIYLCAAPALLQLPIRKSLCSVERIAAPPKGAEKPRLFAILICMVWESGSEESWDKIL